MPCGHLQEEDKKAEICKKTKTNPTLPLCKKTQFRILSIVLMFKDSAYTEMCICVAPIFHGSQYLALSLCICALKAFIF